MAKYIGTYTNSGAVQTALDNQELSRPFVAYTTDEKKVFYGPEMELAEVGDIVVYSVADDLLHYIKQADYNTTSYPTAAYVPVGVVANSQTVDLEKGKQEITFMGTKWMDKNNPDTGNNDMSEMEWGDTTFDVPGLTNYATAEEAKEDKNGKTNTAFVLENATGQGDWKTASAITFVNGERMFPLFECAWRYHTSGTAQGDWYIPAAAQLYDLKYDEDKLNALNSGFTKIGINSFVFGLNGIGTSTEKDAGNAWRYQGRSSLSTIGKNRTDHYNGFPGRPFCSKLMTRI